MDEHYKTISAHIWNYWAKVNYTVSIKIEHLSTKLPLPGGQPMSMTLYIADGSDNVIINDIIEERDLSDLIAWAIHPCTD